MILSQNTATVPGVILVKWKNNNNCLWGRSPKVRRSRSDKLEQLDKSQNFGLFCSDSIWRKNDLARESEVLSDHGSTIWTFLRWSSFFLKLVESQVKGTRYSRIDSNTGMMDSDAIGWLTWLSVCRPPLALKILFSGILRFYLATREGYYHFQVWG